MTQHSFAQPKPSPGPHGLQRRTALLAVPGLALGLPSAAAAQSLGSRLQS